MKRSQGLNATGPNTSLYSAVGMECCCDVRIGGVSHGLGGWAPKMSLSPHRETSWSRIGGELCEILKFWSFLQSKYVSTVCKLLRLWTPLVDVRHPDPLDYSPQIKILGDATGCAVTLTFDLLTQNIISIFMNPNTSVTKIGWNSLRWISACDAFIERIVALLPWCSSICLSISHLYMACRLWN